MVRRTIEIKGKTTIETFYYISSLKTPEDGECNLFAKAVRKHWGVESCHWILDVVFKCRQQQSIELERIMVQLTNQC